MLLVEQMFTINMSSGGTAIMEPTKAGRSTLFPQSQLTSSHLRMELSSTLDPRCLEIDSYSGMRI
jgi:hypothetical protein